MDRDSKIKNITLQGQELINNYNETLSMLDDENIEKYFRNRLFGLKAIIARIERKTQGKDIAYNFEALNSKEHD